ncbi:hypothetical protein C9374_004422 [Naegleria lovaniensis]|uniref:F-box domain-containing protein n=1 Tax=Naegleria lovaniensis TaxID=51637 RepID=A0AA88GS41_NAELO|nr:uncharacterized protein C9374_004422 [Naegleria lovaniensis]KAG2383085.1 hypothetical protein C9374_004422 [Naegleria lovaniensis]
MGNSQPPVDPLFSKTSFHGEYKTSFLPDDMIIHILQYLDSTLIASNIMLVSKQWFQCARREVFTCLQWTDSSLWKIQTHEISRPGKQFKAAVFCRCFFWKKLNLSSSYISDVGAEWISLSPQMEFLTEMNINDTGLTFRGVELIANSPLMKNLTILNISQNTIGDEGVYVIANSKYMSNVTELNLSDIDITNACLNDLKKSKFLKKLRSLDLSQNRQIGNDGMTLLITNQNLSHLTYLNLSQCTLTEAGAITLTANNSSLANLTELNLSFNSIGHDGVLALTHCTVLNNLKILDLGNTEIRQETATLIIQSTLFSHLEKLHLYGNNLNTVQLTSIAKTKNSVISFTVINPKKRMLVTLEMLVDQTEQLMKLSHQFHHFDGEK